MAHEHVFYASGLLVHNCTTCEDLEAKNPYSVADSPVPGIHGFCRCVLMPTSVLPATTVDAYLGGGSQ